MVVTTEEVFGCWSKACAPPPAGRGGSVKGGPWSNRQKIAKHGKGKYRDPSKFDPNESEAAGKARVRAAGKAAVARWDKATGRAKRSSIKDEPMSKAKTKYDDYVSKFGKKN
jgi:hypothetical protein